MLAYLLLYEDSISALLGHTYCTTTDLKLTALMTDMSGGSHMIGLVIIRWRFCVRSNIHEEGWWWRSGKEVGWDFSRSMYIPQQSCHLRSTVPKATWKLVTKSFVPYAHQYYGLPAKLSRKCSFLKLCFTDIPTTSQKIWLKLFLSSIQTNMIRSRNFSVKLRSLAKRYKILHMRSGQNYRWLLISCSRISRKMNSAY